MWLQDRTVSSDGNLDGRFSPFALNQASSLLSSVTHITHTGLWKEIHATSTFVTYFVTVFLLSISTSLANFCLFFIFHLFSEHVVMSVRNGHEWQRGGLFFILSHDQTWKRVQTWNDKRRDWTAEWLSKASQLDRRFSVWKSWYFHSAALLVYMKFKWRRNAKTEVPRPVCAFKQGTLSIAISHPHQSPPPIKPISPPIFIFNALLRLFIVFMMG